MSNTLEVAQGELAGSHPSTVWGELISPGKGTGARRLWFRDYYKHPALTVNTFGKGRAYLATQSSAAS